MLNTTLSGPRLRLSPLPGLGDHPVCYGVGSLLQISPTECALIVNRRILGEAVVDLEDGADAFVIGDLDELHRAQPIPLVRNEPGVHPETDQELLMVQYLGTGGFVPLGALLPDGRPHPAAGTGFAIGSALGYPADLSERIHAAGADLHQFMNILQFHYDGETFHIDRVDRLANEEVLPGFRVRRHPLRNAIPDGKDLLTGIVAGPIERERWEIPIDHRNADARLGRNYGCCCARWRHDGNDWRIVEIHPATPADMSFEPSIVRDIDGTLLMAVRGKGLAEPPGAVHDGLENTYEHFRVLRSADGGGTWEPVLHLPRRRNATPVVLNRTLSGRPFLAANGWRAAPVREGKAPLTSVMRRWRLSLWPLTDDRRSVSEGICVLDCNEHFGPPRKDVEDQLPRGNTWNIDHPVGAVCRLRDGRLRSLLNFRVTDSAVNQGGARTPAGPAGHWIEEVTEPNGPEPRPVWRFED